MHACMEIANDMIRVSSKMGDGLPNFWLCLWEKLRNQTTAPWEITVTGLV